MVTNLGTPYRHYVTSLQPFRKAVIITCRNKSDLSFLISTSYFYSNWELQKQQIHCEA